MEELLGNYDVLERLVQFLPVPDLVKLLSVGRELRDILGGEQVWRRVARRQGAEREDDYLVKEYDEYVGCSNKAGLEPLCRSFFVTVYPAYLRRRWRTGRRKTRFMTVPPDLKKDIVSCFDVCQEFVAIGTIFGHILVWRFMTGENEPEILKGSIEEKIDKICVRHNKIIALQNALISVFILKEELFHFQYSKSFESPENDDAESEHQSCLPKVTRVQLSLNNCKPLRPTRYPDQDFSFSRTGKEIFATARVGNNQVTVHHLHDGKLLHTFSLPEDMRVLKVAIVNINDETTLLYLVTWKGCDKTSLQGMFYNLDTYEFTPHLHLQQQFDCHAGFISLFTAQGLLSCAGEEEPVIFSFNCWTYLGGKEYSFSLYKDYKLCLAECKLRSLVTPRALNYFYRTPHTIIISQRADKGPSIVCYSGAGEGWSIIPGAQGERSNALLGGSEAGGVVCVGTGSHSVQVVDIETGETLWEERLRVEIENMWVGDGFIVTVPKNFEMSNTVALLSVL